MLTIEQERREYGVMASFGGGMLRDGEHIVIVERAAMARGKPERRKPPKPVVTFVGHGCSDTISVSLQ